MTENSNRNKGVELVTQPKGYEWVTDGEKMCPVHALVAIANGEDPYKVFSPTHSVHHTSRVEWDNRPDNIQVISKSKHISMHKMEKELKEREREMKLDGEWIDRRPGNGSGEYSDQAYDSKAPEDVYRASDATTTFNSREGGDILRSDGTKLSYGRLFRMHHDVHQITNDGAAYSERKQQEYIENLIDITASQLELTDIQRKRLYKYVDDAPFKQSGPLDSETLVLAATTLAVNLDDRWLRREDEFIQLQSDFDASDEQIRTARQFYREQVL